MGTMEQGETRVNWMKLKTRKANNWANNKKQPRKSGEAVCRKQVAMKLLKNCKTRTRGYHLLYQMWAQYSGEPVARIVRLVVEAVLLNFWVAENYCCCLCLM